MHRCGECHPQAFRTYLALPLQEQNGRSADRNHWTVVLVRLPKSSISVMRDDMALALNNPGLGIDHPFIPFYPFIVRVSPLPLLSTSMLIDENADAQHNRRCCVRSRIASPADIKFPQDGHTPLQTLPWCCCLTTCSSHGMRHAAQSRTKSYPG